MKIKGFWKEYLELCRLGFAWMKKYWFLYTLICIGFGIIYFSLTWIYMFGWADFKSLFSKKTTDEDEEVLK